jgi:phosphoglucosamine mutase
VLAELVSSGRPAHQLLRLFDPLPQLLKNVRFSGGQPLDDEKVKKVIAEAEKALDGTGRLVIRKSGTEPLIRVMAEGEDETLVGEVVDRICDAVRKAA